jgi:hypothetical protein
MEGNIFVVLTIEPLPAPIDPSVALRTTSIKKKDFELPAHRLLRPSILHYRNRVFCRVPESLGKPRKTLGNVGKYIGLNEQYIGNTIETRASMKL